MREQRFCGEKDELATEWIQVLVMSSLFFPVEFSLTHGISARLYDLTIFGGLLYVTFTRWPFLWRAFQRPLPLCYLGFCFTAWLSVTVNFWSQTDMLLRGWLMSVRLYEPCLCYLLFSVLHEQSKTERFMKRFFALGSAIALFAIVMCVLQVERFSAGTLFLSGKIYYRPSGLFDDPVCFGFQCGIITVAMLALLWYPATRAKYLWGGLGCLILNASALILSATRSALIFVCMAVLWLALFGGQKKTRRVCLLILAGMVAFAAAAYTSKVFPVANAFIDQRVLLLFRMNRENASMVTSERLQIWRHYMEVLSQQGFKQWLLGNGSGLFEFLIGARTYYPSGKLIADNMSTHNTYLCTLIGAGIFGVLTFVSLWSIATVRAWRTHKQSEIGTCVFLLVLCCFVQMMFCDIMAMVSVLSLVFMLLGGLTATHESPYTV